MNDNDKLHLATDILVFSVSSEQTDNYRKLDKKYFSILLVKKEDDPFKDTWCLPGGFVKINESIDEACNRILKCETNLSNIYSEQLYTFSDVNRYPDKRVVATTYMALIDKNKLQETISRKSQWFNIEIKKNKIILKSDNIILDTNKNLGFDHGKVIKLGINRLQNKIEYTDIIFNMMPKFFTLKDLQLVYEAVLNKKLLDSSFRRIIGKKVCKTEKMQIGVGHRPSALYKYKK